MATFAGTSPITANGVYALPTYVGKEHALTVSDTFDSATVKLEYVDINSNNIEYDSTNTTFTAAGKIVFLATHDTMQLNVTGAGANTNIAATIRQI